MDWDEALDDYLMFKKAQGLRDITVKGHRDVMGLFLKRHPEVRLGRVREAVYVFMGEDIKPATYNIRRNYMRQLFQWAVERGLLDENPMLGLKKRHDDERLASLDADGLRRC